MSTPSSTADQIIASAQTFILAGGYSGFSYADVAEVVGIRKASIHHHFPSKVDLVQAMVARYRQVAEDGLTQLPTALPDPRDQLRAYTDMWARCIADASVPFCVCALLASELPALPPPVADEVRRYFRFLSDWVAAVFTAGTNEGVLFLTEPVDVEAEAFIALVHGAMLSARAYGEPARFAVVVESALRRLFSPAAK